MARLQAASPFIRSLLLAAAIVGAPATVLACLWDHDTLAMERRRFPTVLELITGKFLRHSTEFYEWRIQDRRLKLESGDARPEWYDDLAVAYDKVGRHEDAISTILEKDRHWPDRYETYANLGTFQIHSGRFERGLEFIRRTIEINPEAHFGREIYQQLLVEYVISRQEDENIPAPLSSENRGMGYRNFAKFVIDQTSPDDPDVELTQATRGILGMMRFGQHDSPVLLEALGDLLLSTGWLKDAKRLAARCYLKAAYESDGEDTQAEYRRHAAACLTTHQHVELEDVERLFQEELADAEQWYAGIRRDELRWIAAGDDPEREFAAKYYEEPSVVGSTRIEMSRSAGLIIWLVGLGLALTSLCVTLLVCAIYLWRRWTGSRIAQSDPREPV